MMKRTLLTVALSAFMLAPVAAQAQTQVGGQVSWADDTDIGVGARAMFPLTALHPQLAFVPSFDVFFPGDNLSYWEVNANLHFTFPGGSPAVRPYMGAGLNVARASIRTPVVRVSDTELGVNILGGVRFPMNGLTPFAEAKFELGGGEQFVIAGGLLFRLGGN